MGNRPAHETATLRRVAFTTCLWLGTLPTVASAARPAPPGAVELNVDGSRLVGEIRPLHGVNKGPDTAGGTVDLSAFFRDAKIPLTRLHDCHWPNPDVVDIHTVFPNFNADPTRPESYDFRRTDAYLKTLHDTGSAIVYRLGESIEHTRTKYHVHPPADPEKWAAICLGVIRHYNQGWADGFRYDIKYWEIWNEPDNRPNCWTGDDAAFFRLYGTAAKAIKRQFPDLKVGGPGVGNTGRIADGRLDAPPFVTGFLEHCKRESLPLDFFSWHIYTADPRVLPAQARAVRDLLDRHGFTRDRTESHLNEWNYLPDNDWAPVLLSGQGEKRRRFYDRMAGPEGASFVAAALLLLQDAPVDAANFFAADVDGFGLFDPYGGPKKTFHAFKAFRLLTDTPLRVKAAAAAAAAAGESDSVVACAGMSRDRSRVNVLVSHLRDADALLRLTVAGLPWTGATEYEVLAVDAEHDLRSVHRGVVGGPHDFTLDRRLEGRGVWLIALRKSAP